ncbi:MAG: hypothetical protein ACU0GG_07410 [Paracoccaceae bacterium]
MQWWPFRPKYLRLLHAYRAYTTGRCAPAALVRRNDGTFTATDIIEAPDHPEDTWLVQPFWGKAGPERVRTRDIVDIECARVVAGYEC